MRRTIPIYANDMHLSVSVDNLPLTFYYTLSEIYWTITNNLRCFNIGRQNRLDYYKCGRFAMNLHQNTLLDIFGCAYV